MNTLAIIVEDVLAVGVFVDRTARAVNEFALADSRVPHASNLSKQDRGAMSQAQILDFLPRQKSWALASVATAAEP